MNERALLAAEARYCSFGDTVHYVEPPKVFERCSGSYLFDSRGIAYLDLQMWYSAVNFGYANQRLADAMRRQLDKLPQVASQYLHPTKIELDPLFDCTKSSLREHCAERGLPHRPIVDFADATLAWRELADGTAFAWPREEAA